MSYTLPQLPYNYDALAPAISEQTLRTHYDKHHQGYVKKMNALLPGSGFENASLEEIVMKAKGALFNNAAQVWNHTFYWESLAPAEECHPIDHYPEVKQALVSSFGSVAAFTEAFMESGKTQFGSGWTWLAKAPKERKLVVLSTSNAENPMREGYVPLWVCDVWEHAYYLDYKNERDRYLQNFWGIANWGRVQTRLLQAFERT